MCGRFTQHPPARLDAAAGAALAALDGGLDLAGRLNQREPVYNLAPTMTAAVMARDQQGALTVKGLRWGLVPHWADDPKIGNRAINARRETVAEKPMFRAAFRKRRCIVPMNGYFEWKSEATGKQPYLVHAADNESLLLCAGLWEAWRPSQADDWVRSFTILTAGAGLVSGDLHDRQPVVVPAERLSAWLDGSTEAAQQALKGLPDPALTYYPVTRAVGSVSNQSADAIRAVRR